MKLSVVLYLWAATVCWDTCSTRPAKSSYSLTSLKWTIGVDLPPLHLGKGRGLSSGQTTSPFPGSCRPWLLVIKSCPIQWWCSGAGGARELIWSRHKGESPPWRPVRLTLTSQLGHSQALLLLQDKESKTFPCSSPKIKPFSCSLCFQ